MESLQNQMPESATPVSNISGMIASQNHAVGYARAYIQNSTKYNINIELLDRGYLVTVGCQRIALSSKEELKKNFNEYIDNPTEYTKKYNNNEVLTQE